MSYFGEQQEPGGEVTVVPAGELRTLGVADGISIAPLLGEALNINVVVLEPGAVAGLHTHPEEQIGYVVSGTLMFTDGERTWTIGPGDCYRAAPSAAHGATAGSERCIVIDAFSPPRSGIREMLAQEGPQDIAT